MKPVKISSNLNSLMTDAEEGQTKKRKISDSVKAVLNSGVEQSNQEFDMTATFKGPRSLSSLGGGRIRSAVANLLQEDE